METNGASASKNIIAVPVVEKSINRESVFVLTKSLFYLTLKARRSS
jgi:hypothetical protein